MKGACAYGFSTSPETFSSSLTRRAETARSSFPAVTALIPPVLPRLGNTFTLTSECFFPKASPRCFIPPLAPPVPEILTVSSAKTAGTRNARTVRIATNRNPVISPPSGNATACRFHQGYWLNMLIGGMVGNICNY